MKNRRTVFNWAVVTLLVTMIAMPAAAQSVRGGQVIQSSELEQFLAQAKITGWKDLEGVTRSRRATMQLNDRTEYAVFKTIDEKKSGATQLDRGIEIEFQDSWRTDVAAYELDKLLGLGMVPTTIERRADGKQGSFQFWITSKMTEAERLEKKINPPNPVDWNQQVAKMRLFDNLIYNTDRHMNNLKITEDWTIRLIDHSRSFRPFTQLKDPKQLTTFSRTLLAKLEELNEPILNERLGKYLTPYQIQGLLKRRDAIIALSKKLVAEKGAGAVLYH